MKQYKIDAFKGYEKFMKKIGRKEGYICYIYWPFKNRVTLKLTYANYWAKKPKDGHGSGAFMFSPSIECDVCRFDKNGNEIDTYKETYDSLVRMHNDFRRMKKAFEEGKK